MDSAPSPRRAEARNFNKDHGGTGQATLNMNNTYWMERHTVRYLNAFSFRCVASQFERTSPALVLLQHLPANNHQLHSMFDGCQQRYLGTMWDSIRFKIYMAVRIHIMVFWVMTPCTVVKHTAYTITSTLKMKAVGSSEMLVHTYETMLPEIPWQHNLNIDCWENFRSHTNIKLIQYTCITMYPKYYTETTLS
jgi:hypothetical protein